MGMQSARMIYKGKDHKDIYFQGKYHDKMYISDNLIWEKMRHPKFSQFFMVNAMPSAYGDHLIDEYGVRLDVNKDAIIEKCAVYLLNFGLEWRRTIACTGQNITYARYVPYLSYDGEIIFDGLSIIGINTFDLSQNSNGVWNYNNYSTINANISGADGKKLTVYSVGVDSVNTRIFYDLSEMKAWLES